MGKPRKGTSTTSRHADSEDMVTALNHILHKADSDALFPPPFTLFPTAFAQPCLALWLHWPTIAMELAGSRSLYSCSETTVRLLSQVAHLRYWLRTSITAEEVYIQALNAIECLPPSPPLAKLPGFDKETTYAKALAQYESSIKRTVSGRRELVTTMQHQLEVLHILKVRTGDVVIKKGKAWRISVADHVPHMAFKHLGSSAKTTFENQHNSWWKKQQLSLLSHSWSRWSK